MIKPKIKKIELDDGDSFEYVERIFRLFQEKYPDNPHSANYNFHNQYQNFEESILSVLHLDVEEYAKQQYNLIPESKKKELKDFSDNEIEGEFISRGGRYEEFELDNTNIINESFLTRFITVINRGNDTEIEQVLNSLEEKYRIK